MNELTTKIGPSGRIVIPASFRKAMGVETGDEVVIRIEEGEVRILSRAVAICRAQAAVREAFGRDRSLSEELIAQRRTEAARG